MKTAYIASSWFNPDQVAFLDAASAQLQANPTLDWANSFRPKDHTYKDWTPATHPDMLANSEWQLATFNADVAGINASDLVVAIYDPTPANSDPGVLWELGYAYGCHKPVILVLPDTLTRDLNLMPAMGATVVLRQADLATFNFARLHYQPFSGKVY
ncbi:MAG: nucleoside 2-deoxyribosyltransferase [Lactobacillus sp.]|jgi:nucleoside deoxyribosyltransferase|nr:nucleoside 2-deoxyribosyltransferase [Lactobacillus sp.]MCI2031973.1 nucleoside 2-deoxyribosyltransferase [Lactobacillus sp.]